MKFISLTMSTVAFISFSPPVTTTNHSTYTATLFQFIGIRPQLPVILKPHIRSLSPVLVRPSSLLPYCSATLLFSTSVLAYPRKTVELPPLLADEWRVPDGECARNILIPI